MHQGGKVHMIVIVTGKSTTHIQGIYCVMCRQQLEDYSGDGMIEEGYVDKGENGH